MNAFNAANVDLICDNIFAEKDGSKIIDYEWVFPFAVPVLFIMWRMIHELYTKIPRLVRLCPEETMMEKFGISYSDYEIFRQWTLHFVYEYVGSDSLDVYRKKRISVDFTRIVEKELDKNRMYTKLYYDLGKGLNETNTIRQSIQLERDRFEVTFDFSAIEGMRGMRWNPVQGRMCRVQIENVECECKAEFVPWGAHVQNNGQTTTFLNTDPAYYINVWEPENLKSIKIQGRIHFLELNDVEQMITTIQAQLQNQNAEDGIKHPEKQEVVADGRGKIAAVKKLVKQMIGKEPREEVHGMRNSCMGSVDQFHYEKNTLSLAGWAFDNKYPMKRARIAFYANGKKIQEYPFIVIFRKDVAAALGNPAAEGCGFIFSASVQTAKSLNVFLEYDIEVGTGQFHLGTIPAEAGRGSEDEIWIFPIEDPKSLGNLRFFMKHHLMAKPLVYPESLAKQTIDVIIPVYNGLEYFDKLFAGIEKTRLSYRLIIVDDKSPDPRVKEYLDRYAAAHENVILLRNEQNMGFLPSVNRALAMAENHVALVNTDVEVPEEWLERLMLPIITKEKVATSTPFTTCGTICSFPRFCEDNPIFEEMQLWQIDEVFRKVKPQYPVMPTGIGFCMGMNIHAIRKVGLLDAKTFGKGYGEENDWCQRAIKAGYQNVQADNLFVYHKHGGSFSSEEKRRLLEHNLAELSRKHPNYNRDTAEYCRRDPSRTIRQYAVLKLLNKKLDVPTIVAFDHNLGGGATEYLIEKRRIALSEGYRFITIRYDNPGTKYYLNYEYKSYEIECFSNELETLLEQIQRVDEIWINELVTYQNFYQTLSRIVELKREHKAHLKMLLHDFFFVCPAINLMNAEGKYCGAAEAEVCNQCIPCNKSNACLEYESGSVWRERWKNFLLECDAIIAFSDDTARLFKKVYPDVYHLHVIPHKPHYLPALDKKVKTTNTLNIGLLGVLCYKKGLDVVKQMVSYIEQNQLNIRIKLIGVTDEEIDSPVFSCTGRYTRDQLPRLTMQEDIDVFLIPSIWPETFSYTTSEIMSMNMPVAVFPIGAPVERVQHYAKGLVISKADTETIISEITDFIEHTLQYSQMMIQNKKILFVGEEISFASRYRVEHFREQLIYHGYASEFIQIDEREQIDMSKYAALVFYRCSNRAGVEKLVKLARKLEMAVYYDIDDFIFRYDEISHLHFLTGSEYADFREKTEQIHACMELCDGYFTSTNTLAEQIQKEFPEKPVVINRNCASVEMQVLSHEALEQTDKDPDKICIGYFSGSRTHDQDFEVAEKALKYVLEKYPQVHIKLVGVLSESKLKGMESRTEKLPFMAWQQLPAAIAGIDINLMPLEDSLFQCCKSENKWMEAALVKVPSVMSRNREMELVIENGKTAWLCQTEEEWIQALENLITDEKARRAMGENAYQVVMEHYVTSNTGKDAREELLCSRGFSK